MTRGSAVFCGGQWGSGTSLCANCGVVLAAAGWSLCVAKDERER